uniref:RING-type domain-containing protein n=1 Tax=Xiphophorus couchianus TaxID=32473 RepID=A0A3B5KXD4_9TELE
MPLFSRRRKPSEDSKKRLEHQLYWSNQEGADDILDVSACELTELQLPTKVFSICKVQQKKVLILHTNELKFLLPKGCDICCLATLKVLDLHENKLSVLPEEIGTLTKLQILNVEKNRLKVLPESVCRLQLLQTLNLKNCLMELPAAIGSLSSLRTLDISDNNVLQLPKHLAHIRTLELGEEYCAPSQYLLPVLESECSKPGSDCLDGLEEAWQSKFSDYERRKELKLQEKLAFERHLEEKHREHTQLLLMNNSHKENILNSDQQRVELGFSQQQRAQEAERQQVLERVRQAEDNISGRISSLLMDNSQKKSAEFLQAMEEDIRMEQLTAVTQEEAGSLRRREVALESLDRKFDRMLSLQVLDKSKAIAQILQEEEMQKAAFQALQLQKDAVHVYIRSQIKLIEAELMQLTKLEVKRRSLDAESLQEVLVEQRTALSDLLQQLLKQRDQREQELRQVLPGTPVTPSAPTPVEGPGSSECVVCMETGVVFLPCGHVCCCQVCSDALQNCPLCRSNISQRIRLYQN